MTEDEQFNQLTATQLQRELVAAQVNLIRMDKQYHTRSGLPVRVLCIDKLNTPYPVVALVTEYGKEALIGYTALGNSTLGTNNVSRAVNHYDLILNKESL